MIYYGFSKVSAEINKKKKGKNLIGQTLCIEAPELSSNQPAVHQALCGTIHSSQEICIENPRKASILTLGPSLHLEAE
jgi:hypothetical protein